MIKISFSTDNGTAAPLFRQYPGQVFQQRAYLEFDPTADELELCASYNAEIGNAVPMHVWEGKIHWFAIPANASRASIEALAQDAELEILLQDLKGDEDLKLDVVNYLENKLISCSVWQAHEWVGQAEIDLEELVECGSVADLSDLLEPDPHEEQVVLGDLADAVASQIERQLEWMDPADKTARRAAEIVAAYRG